MQPGDRVIITGAASGIGLATAMEFARLGAQVFLADIERQALAIARDKVAAVASAESHQMVCNVSDEGAVDALAMRAFDEMGGVDTVFCNAGVGVSGPLADMTSADWSWVLGVNLWGVVHGIKSFVPRMLKQGTGGTVLFNASFAGLVSVENLGAYSASKASVVAIAEALRAELKPHNIQVSVVCPMRVDSEIGSSMRNRDPEQRTASRARDVFDPRDDSVGGAIISADDAARQIIAGIERDELYILTHPDGRSAVRRRFERIDKSYSRQHQD